MNRKKYLVDKFKLSKHVEGGWFNETYASDLSFEDHSLATSIYFLLDNENFSAFHQLSYDELWFYHEGSALTLVMIDEKGLLHQVKLGIDYEKGEVPYFCVPAGWIFGSFVDASYCFVSCVVVPGFQYEDFRLYNRKELMDLFPQHEPIINRLTR